MSKTYTLTRLFGEHPTVTVEAASPRDAVKTVAPPWTTVTLTGSDTVRERTTWRLADGTVVVCAPLMTEAA